MWELCIISGAPQGSILGLLLFNLYMHPLGYIIKKPNVSFNFYADDSQQYLPLKAGIHFNRYWKVLQFNEDKTETIVFGSPKLNRN